MKTNSPNVRNRHLLLAVFIALGLVVFVWIAVEAAGRRIDQQVQESTPEVESPVMRERDAEPDTPTISFIDSPAPTCSLPQKGTDICFIDWNYLYVDGGSSYIISMTIEIDGKVRAYHSGFFQTSMVIPGNMMQPGFKVVCGLPGASGTPWLGNTHSYIIRARDSAGLMAANYGSLACPSDVIPPKFIYLPLVIR